MERLSFWRDLAERLGEVGDLAGEGGVSAAAGLRTEAGKIAFFWNGRELSTEAYLEVPTFLRRGLRPAG